MNLLSEYKNGNYCVKIYDDGTKERIYDEDPRPVYPESIDIKITDYCDANCSFCHENSTISGLHSDEFFVLNIFKNLPRGMELALGGGNPLAWSGLEKTLEELSDRGFVCNMTVNSVHVKKYYDTIKKYVNDRKIHGLGISYFPSMFHNCLPLTQLTNNLVFHVITGIHTVDDIKKLISNVENPKILLLGYKKHGRGTNYFDLSVEKNLKEWYVRLHELFSLKNLTLSFDNLAIEQLKLKRFFNEEKWKSFYMGNDGEFTFYIDFVKQEYCKSSTSKTRFPIKPTDTIEKMFSDIKTQK